MQGLCRGRASSTVRSKNPPALRCPPGRAPGLPSAQAAPGQGSAAPRELRLLRAAAASCRGQGRTRSAFRLSASRLAAGIPLRLKWRSRTRRRPESWPVLPGLRARQAMPYCRSVPAPAWARRRTARAGFCRTGQGPAAALPPAPVCPGRRLQSGHGVLSC